MKKVAWTAVIVALVLAMAVPAALAVSENRESELQALYEQMHELRLKILEKQVEAGLIDEGDAAVVREKMQERWEWLKQRMEEGDFSCEPRGCMMRGGKAGCFGYGPCPGIESKTQVEGTSFRRVNRTL